jgi:hypothetical protein
MMVTTIVLTKQCVCVCVRACARARVYIYLYTAYFQALSFSHRLHSGKW